LREKKNKNVKLGSTSLTPFSYVEKIYDDGTQMINIIFKGNYKIQGCFRVWNEEALKNCIIT
jgi:hypothetical protein